MKDEDPNVAMYWVFVVMGVLIPVIYWRETAALVVGAVLLSTGVFNLGKASK